MGYLVVVLAVAVSVDPGEMFGWVQTALTQLGVWGYIQAALTVSVILASVAAVLRFLRG